VAIGYDLNTRQIILRSGDQERSVAAARRRFERTWDRSDRWALVVLRPDDLPATADVATWSIAAAGLEQADRPGEALTAYETILTRSPDSVAAKMGRANSLFALKDFSGAASAYRKVLSDRPEMADAWNNLAYALYRQGKRDEAITAARQAVAVGWNDGQAYKATLTDVSRPIAKQE